MTLEELKNAAAAAPGVIAAEVTLGPQPASGFAGLHGAVISVVVDAGGNVFRRTNHDVLITGSGTPEEVAGWVNGLPQVLHVDPPLLGGKVDAAAVETFCNAKWKAANTQATDIREFSVQPINPTTLRVSGLFDVSGTREPRQYLIWLVDPNGAVSGSNAKFERLMG